MAFTQATFAPVSSHSSNTPNIYSYKTTDTLADVQDAAYFADKSAQIEDGDFFLVYAADGSALFQAIGGQIFLFLGTSYVAVTANYTVTDGDYFVNGTANSFTVTLPTAVGREGRRFNIKNSGTGSITVDADGSEVIDDALTQSLTQWDSITLVSDGAGWLVE